MKVFVIDVLWKGFPGKIYKDDLGYVAISNCSPGFSSYSNSLESVIDSYAKMCDDWIVKYQKLARGY